eukprot:TRINITY_DN47024_c0_g1_i1.p1 TRINITY_DN47024_c0_g1~~TRINITY_DN47024_c0_g1_i1.p1  ORF type:complete len:196 (+),score=80.85 TRINITY_DN47024_c0_g1_i1:83-589(+)
MTFVIAFMPDALPNALVSRVPPVLTGVQGIYAATFTTYLPQMMRIAITASSGTPYNNTDPRAQVVQLIDKGGDVAGKISRAQAAHMNGFEDLGLFGIATLTALTAGVDKTVISRLATLHAIARFVYNFLYVYGTSQGVAALRSLAYMIGIGCSFKLLHAARKQQRMAW